MNYHWTPTDTVTSWRQIDLVKRAEFNFLLFRKKKEKNLPVNINPENSSEPDAVCSP